jgi:hypothetical protein
MHGVCMHVACMHATVWQRARMFMQLQPTSLHASLTHSRVNAPMQPPCKPHPPGYCGLMLAVCEDPGLAAAAAKRTAAPGALTIPQLLQWSAVCGCGLDTVPVPGPGRAWGRLYAAIEPGAPAPDVLAAAVDALAAAAEQVGVEGAEDGGGGGGGGGVAAAAPAAAAEPESWWVRTGKVLTFQSLGGGKLSGRAAVKKPAAARGGSGLLMGRRAQAAGAQDKGGEEEGAPSSALSLGATAAAADRALLTAFTGVILDTWLLAARLGKPLAARLLPLPGKRSGDATAFDNPYLINSRVMKLA